MGARFLTRDRIEALTRSAYGYAGNNPTNFTDPLGLCKVGPVRVGFLSNDDGGCKGAEAVRKYADDVSTVAGGVAAGCGTVTAFVPNPVTGACAGAAVTVSLAASTLHTAVTCADWDRYCANSAAATALNFGTAGTSNFLFNRLSRLTGDDRFFLNFLFGTGEFSSWIVGFMPDTTERPNDDC